MILLLLQRNRRLQSVCAIDIRLGCVTYRPTGCEVNVNVNKIVALGIVNIIVSTALCIQDMLTSDNDWLCAVYRHLLFTG